MLLCRSSSAQLQWSDVPLCLLFIQYAELDTTDRIRDPLFKLLYHEVSSAEPRKIDELKRDLDAVVYARLDKQLDKAVASVDNLVQISTDLATAAEKEDEWWDGGEEAVSMGWFGIFCRRMILTFKQTSFERFCQVYDDLLDARENKPASVKRGALGLPEVELLAFDLAHEIPWAYGRVPFVSIEEVLTTFQKEVPNFHRVHFVQYLHYLNNKMSRCSSFSLRAFHDGNQQHYRSTWQQSTQAGPNAAPDFIQYSTLSLATLYYQLGFFEPAERALMESVKASQETSDARCLCAALQTLSLIYQAQGQTAKAFHMLQRALGRSELLCLSELQIVCCLGIARLICLRKNKSSAQFPPLKDDTKLAAHRMALRRLWQPRSPSVVDALAYVALAYMTLGSPELRTGETQDLSSWARMLLCLIEVARVNQLEMRKPFIEMLLTKAHELNGSDLGLAISCAVQHAMRNNLKLAEPYVKAAAQCLPCAPGLWLPYAASPYVSHLLAAKKRYQLALSVNVEFAASLLTVSDQESLAFELHRQSVNYLRLTIGNLHAFAYDEPWRDERHVMATDTCDRILLLARAHLRAGTNFVNVLALSLHCLVIAEAKNLRQSRAEALILVCRVKYITGDAVTALQIMSDLQVEINGCKSKVIGEAHFLIAEILLSLALDVDMSMLANAALSLEKAVVEFYNVQEYDNIKECFYLLARISHQFKMYKQRDMYAKYFREGLPLPREPDPKKKDELLPRPVRMPSALHRLGTTGFPGHPMNSHFYPLATALW